MTPRLAGERCASAKHRRSRNPGAEGDIHRSGGNSVGYKAHEGEGARACGWAHTGSRTTHVYLRTASIAPLSRRHQGRGFRRVDSPRLRNDGTTLQWQHDEGASCGHGGVGYRH